MTAYSTLQADTQTCNCAERARVSFSSCDPGHADWREHDDADIGLTGHCLPEVPAKYVYRLVTLKSHTCIIADIKLHDWKGCNLAIIVVNLFLIAVP